MFEILFWVFLFATAYSYFIYPLILWLMPKREVLTQADGELPSLTLIITAHNEEGRIRDKLVNTLEIDYPAEKLEVLVASDCCTDKTEDIVAEYADRGVKVVRATERKGKEHAQGLAIQAATGDILVFSDVATKIPSESAKILAGKFSDAKVGAVSSEDRFLSEDGSIVGEGLYVKYEMWLRRQESAVNSLVGLSGSFFAARKQVCELWDILSPSDFNTALNCARQGFVAVTAPDVLGYYKDVKDSSKEYQRKHRTVIRGITAVFRSPEILNIGKYGFFAVQVWSHKIMRWLVPWFMLALFMINLIVLHLGGIYTLALLAQLAFYICAISGFASEGARKHVFVKIPYFFVQANVALAHATVAYLGGKRMYVWTPSKR